MVGLDPPGLLLAQPAVLTLLLLHITKSVSQAVEVQPLQVPAPRYGCGHPRCPFPGVDVDATKRTGHAPNLAPLPMPFKW